MMCETKYYYSEDPVIHEAVREAYANINLRHSHALSDPRFSWNDYDQQYIGDINWNWIGDCEATQSPNVYPEQSEWICYLFGGEYDSGIGWRPLKGKHPNWFWRKMQYIMFGNNWVKDD